ncbi:Putative addiction module domain-containing protein [Desulfonema limicola]|uniref:Addiction module domain-containing protein n=1 Tax=Desulfonema limicola TaxID=45656 RepID=A0A975B7R5_9BACT|nr:addiction module protein [Desulfonema limicola]QTA80228.1 Putative addiction module domain-containing protein [Desulfonema limicola]
MDLTVENIAKKALSLSLSSRAYLAEVLLESIDFEDDFIISQEWLDEIHKRCREIDNQDVKLIDGEKALRNLRKKYEAI